MSRRIHLKGESKNLSTDLKFILKVKKSKGKPRLGFALLLPHECLQNRYNKMIFKVKVGPVECSICLQSGSEVCNFSAQNMNITIMINV